MRTPVLVIVCALIALGLLFSPIGWGLGGGVLGLVGGALGIVVALVAGTFGVALGLAGALFGAVTGILGGLFGLAVGLGVPLLLFGLPILILAALVIGLIKLARLN